VLACNNSYMGVKNVSPYNPNMSLGICAYGGVLLYAMCKYLIFMSMKYACLLFKPMDGDSAKHPVTSSHG
jgi:hypothetical protein